MHFGRFSGGEQRSMSDSVVWLEDFGRHVELKEQTALR